MGKNKSPVIISKHFLVILFLSFYFVVTSIKLITSPRPFYDWDESINVQVSKETIEKKSLVPLWQGKAWLDKPPLPFLFFGLVMKLTPFVSPEISLRMTSLVLSIIALIFVYLIYLKVETSRLNLKVETSRLNLKVETSRLNLKVETSRRDVSTTIIPFLTVIITAFTPIFLQRSQILNLDVFLLIGWLGYLLFVQNFWLSLFFLTVGVLTKSLLGFYPVVVLILYYSYLHISNKIKFIEYKKIFLKLSSHLAILAIWYIVMLLIFKEQFWQQHIIETHFRRVTASIESHFGQITYYVDLMMQQLGIFFWISLVGLALIFWQTLNYYFSSKRSASRNNNSLFSTSSNDKLLYSLFLFPWFIFLNLTKTKIFWYLYPAIPQFAFLSVYPLSLLSFPQFSLSFPRKWESRGLLNRIRIPTSPIGFAGRGRYGMTIVGIIIFGYIFHLNFIKANFFTTFYSKPEDYYHLALYAKDHCNSLSVLVGKETRAATKTLEKLGLTITSTKQWGDHPSIIYYFGAKVNFYYDKKLLENKISSFSKNDCLIIRKDDLNLNREINQLNLEKSFDSLYLFKR